MVEAVLKSLASWVNWLAAAVLPLVVALWAAACRFVEICCVTCAYLLGSVC